MFILYIDIYVVKYTHLSACQIYISVTEEDASCWSPFRAGLAVRRLGLCMDIPHLPSTQGCPKPLTQGAPCPWQPHPVSD